MLNFGAVRKLVLIAGVIGGIFSLAGGQAACFAQNQNDDTSKPAAKSGYKNGGEERRGDSACCGAGTR